MKKIRIIEHISLDGVIQAPGEHAAEIPSALSDPREAIERNL